MTVISDNPFATAAVSVVDMTDYASERQVEFISKLLLERLWATGSPKYVARTMEIVKAITAAMQADAQSAGMMGQEVSAQLIEAGRKPLTRAGASALITALKDCERAKGVTSTAPAAEREIEDGFYEFTYDRGKVAIAKVQTAVHGSGHQYAKQLDPETGKFEYVGGLMAEVRSSGVLLSLERAKELGHLYGRCIRCGRTLTDEGSIEAGIGPVCAGKF